MDTTSVKQKHEPLGSPQCFQHWGLVSARACGSVKTLWLKLCLLHIRSSAERNAYPGVSGNSLKTVLCAIRYVCPINVICLYASVCVNLCHVQKVNTMLYGSQESFNKATEDIQRIFPEYYVYLSRNWLPIADMFAGYARQTIFHLDNYTNNRLERLVSCLTITFSSSDSVNLVGECKGNFTNVIAGSSITRTVFT